MDLRQRYSAKLICATYPPGRPKNFVVGIMASFVFMATNGDQRGSTYVETHHVLGL